MSNDNVFRIDNVICLKDTGKALLCDVDDALNPIWIPQSVIDDDSEVYDAKDNASGTLVIAYWFAEKAGLV